MKHTLDGKCLTSRLLGGFLLLAASLWCHPASAMKDEACLDCHGDKTMTADRNGKTVSLYVDLSIFKETIHAGNGCVSCHEQADVPEGKDHPVPMKPVKCANCHDKIAETFANSMHGIQALEKKDVHAPTCSDCHTKHNILPPKDRRSSTYILNIPEVCGRCHRDGSEMNNASEHTSTQKNAAKNYTESIHGKGLYVDGLVVTAVCTSCHTPHNVLKASDPKSSVHRDKVMDTCAQCHVGIAEKFKKSVHSPLVTKTDKRLPVCTDCHTSHNIADVFEKDFRLIIARQCGNCHSHESATYIETYHGRASMLFGGEKTAKCSDCHGSHDIMPSQSPESRINVANIVSTCTKCHPNANMSFTQYLAHASHKDKDRYPYLYYTFWFMTALMLGTFAFFGLHTILWVPRSFIERFKTIAKGGGGRH